MNWIDDRRGALSPYIYAEWEEGILFNADNMNVMAQMPDECVDLIVTDPQYGWNFMGLDWDKALPSVESWKECLRVLKPGAFAFIMCGPRQDCQWRMIANLEQAGFDISFSPIYWAYAQGFDKAMNMSKKVDQRLGMEREVIGKKGGRYKYRANGATSNPMGQLIGTEGDWESASNITAPASPEAKALDGAYSGCELKPAVELF